MAIELLLILASLEENDLERWLVFYGIIISIIFHNSDLCKHFAYSL